MKGSFLGFAGDMANPGGCLQGKGKVFSFKPQGHTDQTRDFVKKKKGGRRDTSTYQDTLSDSLD
jgi:hypothetical protein